MGMRMPDERPIHLTAEQARGGEIVLRTPRRRGIFIAGLVGMGLLALIGSLAALEPSNAHNPIASPRDESGVR